MSDADHDRHAETAFIGVLGTRSQRRHLSATFAPWPETDDDVVLLRHRLDSTSGALCLCRDWRKEQDATKDASPEGAFAAAAARGGRVPIVDLFKYMVASVMENESEYFPPCAIRWFKRTLSIILIVAPPLAHIVVQYHRGQVPSVRHVFRAAATRPENRGTRIAR